jgi:1-acyl-sn-glycerol-3-phosphate acyltransferase
LTKETTTYPNYIPRRRFVRRILRRLINLAMGALTDLEIIGRENFPVNGPLLVVGNHFSFMDPIAVINVSPWPIDFLGGTRMPNAPAVVQWIPQLYGITPVHRGSFSRDALVSALKTLDRKGIVGIFPEGGSWATVLRPPRPGVALLALRSRARILPIGLHGLKDVFPKLSRFQRAHVTIHIGKPFGPYYSEERGGRERERLDEVGNEIMQHISELIPEETRGFYSADPAIRAAAKGTEIYPWAHVQET